MPQVAAHGDTFEFGAKFKMSKCQSASDSNLAYGIAFAGAWLMALQGWAMHARLCDESLWWQLTCPKAIAKLICTIFRQNLQVICPKLPNEVQFLYVQLTAVHCAKMKCFPSHCAKNQNFCIGALCSASIWVNANGHSESSSNNFL